MFPTQLLRTATQRKVLRVLAEKNKRYTSDELAEMTHRSKASISRAMKAVHRYPFIERKHVRGGRTNTFRLDPGSPYTAALRDFFDAERERERQSGMIPVEVWNVLEDAAIELERTVPGFLDVYLFGSYATGEFYAGSDIDLVVVHSNEHREKGAVDEAVQKVGDDRLHVFDAPVSKDVSTASEVMDALMQYPAIDGNDTVISLTGEVPI